MKRLVFALLLLSSPAFAQAPQEIKAEDTITVNVNETRVFQFSYPVNRMTVSAKDVVEVVPESDQIFILRGLKPGRTLMTAYSSNGQVRYRSNVSVPNADGELVKIYGNDRGSRDYNAYYCSEFGCGRANVDSPPRPFSTTISNTRTNPDGTSQTISNEYR